MSGMTPARQPTQAERDEPVALDGDYTLEEAARVLMAVKPEDLPEDEQEAGK